MSSVKTSYSIGGTAVDNYFYEYELEYPISESFKTNFICSASVADAKTDSFTLTTGDGNVTKRVFGYGINLI